MSMNRDLFRLSSLANVNVNVVGRANARRLLAGRRAARKRCTSCRRHTRVLFSV